VHAGFSFDNKDLSKALPIIRKIGLQVETEMFEATGNVNTQKGIIFLMGLSLFATGMLFSKQDRFEPESFQNLIKDICKDLVRKELVDAGHPAKSHGEEIFLKYGLSGARGEAESGFQTVIDQAWPLLAAATELDDTLLTRCLLAMASVNQDTNILYRKGIEVLAEFQRLCRIALDDFNSDNYQEVIAYCAQEKISPGGSADLLAVSIFIWSVNKAGIAGFNLKTGKNDL
jgi:holo-ACP synthase/triphosphoribosyl-dephospho-CoA synthase